jgi:hypothetical protein
MVNVVRRAVACETKDCQAAAMRFTQHLHTCRARLEHGVPLQMQRVYQIVGGFRRARVGAGEDLGVGDEESSLALQGQPGIFQETLQLFRIGTRSREAAKKSF